MSKLTDAVRKTSEMMGHHHNMLNSHLAEMDWGDAPEDEANAYRDWLVRLHKLKNDIERALEELPPPEIPLLTDDL